MILYFGFVEISLIMIIPALMDVRFFAISSLFSFAFWLLQTDALQNFKDLADRYGVAVAFSLLMFFYFARQASKAQTEAREYRKEIAAANNRQVEILERVLAEARKNNAICANFTPTQIQGKE